MVRFLGVMALAVLASSVMACGSITLEDYAEECGEWNEDYRSASSVRDLEEALEDWNALSPPGEVKDLHDLRAQAIKLSLEKAEEREALEDQLEDLEDDLDDAKRSERNDIRDEMDDLRDEADDRIDDLNDELQDLEDEWEDAEDELSRRDRRDLDDEDCI